MNTIDFYDPKKTYGLFSNFYVSPITIDNKKFNTVEHYFQYKKFDDSWYQEQIYKQNTPGKVKFLSSQQKGARFPWMKPLYEIVKESLKRGIKPRENWDTIRNFVMIEGVVAKFTQNPRLMKELLATKGKTLREASPRDSYWGIGKDGKGKNMLGKILVCLRDIVIKNPKYQKINH
jgi:ribA/ribD-fused uncharacterized protein